MDMKSKLPWMFSSGNKEDMRERLNEIAGQINEITELRKNLGSAGHKPFDNVISNIYNRSLGLLGHDKSEIRDRARFAIVTINEIKEEIDNLLNKQPELVREYNSLQEKLKEKKTG